MVTRRIVMALAFWAGLGRLLAAGAARAEDLPAEASSFVTGVVEHALAILKDNALTRDERIKRLTDLYIQDFDARGMSLFALGVYAGRTRGGQREDYVEAFKLYVIRQYFSRLEMVGDVFSVSKASPDGEDIAWVVSALGAAGEKPYRVEWRVRKMDGALKIFDVVLEGSSLLWIQRTDFATVLQRNNGDVGKLIELMRLRKVGQDTPND
jgi:phospholipid transport system substrate-binding protein